MSYVHVELGNLRGLVGVGEGSENLDVDMFMLLSMVRVGLNLDPEVGASDDLAG